MKRLFACLLLFAAVVSFAETTVTTTDTKVTGTACEGDHHTDNISVTGSTVKIENLPVTLSDPKPIQQKGLGAALSAIKLDFADMWKDMEIKIDTGSLKSKSLFLALPNVLSLFVSAAFQVLVILSDSIITILFHFLDAILTETLLAAGVSAGQISAFVGVVGEFSGWLDNFVPIRLCFVLVMAAFGFEMTILCYRAYKATMAFTYWIVRMGLAIKQAIPVIG